MKQAGQNAPQLEFPLEWQGRILARGTDESVAEEIARALQGLGFELDLRQGNASSGGNYVTYRVSITLVDRDAMQQVTYALSRIEGVHMVL